MVMVFVCYGTLSGKLTIKRFALNTGILACAASCPRRQFNGKNFKSLIFSVITGKPLPLSFEILAANNSRGNLSGIETYRQYILNSLDKARMDKCISSLSGGGQRLSVRAVAWIVLCWHKVIQPSEDHVFMRVVTVIL
uniref:EH domain-containing protein n=1 Tax=Heterorhabditis bacteriophora TaxID=37862 RepID=A0A1I7W9G6_HETBA